jgi:hypothetical protein
MSNFTLLKQRMSEAAATVSALFSGHRVRTLTHDAAANAQTALLAAPHAPRQVVS